MTATPVKIANPKPAKSRIAGRSSWYRFYAMFSERFAEEVLEMAALGSGSLVLDPWLGAGTTTVVAARNGLRSVGVDLNPVMIAVAGGRCIDQQTASKAIEAIKQASRYLKVTALPDNDPLCEWFGDSSAGAIRAWHRLILDLFPENMNRVESGFLLTVLFEAALQLAGSYRSKNPTWMKKPSTNERADCLAKEMKQSVLSLAQRKVANCQPEPVTQPTILNGTSTKLALSASSVDFVLTSPPYCTRIDYAVSTRIELAVLGYGGEVVGDMRDTMMGTSTIRANAPVPQGRWGTTCNDLLGMVLNHPSRSSANYYHKTFLQYFTDLSSSLMEINRCVKTGAEIVIVVQDSRYKGNRIDLARIVTEMGDSVGWTEVRRDDYDVSQSMQRVNTRSRRYRSDVSSIESVLWFKRLGNRHAR